MRTCGIMFHHFHGQGHDPSQGSIDAATLDAMIQHIGPEHILDAREWLTRAGNGTLPPTAVCLTFDDALRCQWDIALPVLQQYDKTAFWFVYTSVLRGEIEPLEVYRTFRTKCFEDIDAFYDAFFDTIAAGPYATEVEAAHSDFVPERYLDQFPFYTRMDRMFWFTRDRVLGDKRYNEVMEDMIARAGMSKRDLADGLWLTDEHIRQLHAAGHVIGLHSHSHPMRMADLSLDRQRTEYTLNCEHIHSVTGEAAVTMSHPCNSYDERTLQVLRELGIRLGFRANTAQSRWSELEWPREDHANVVQTMQTGQPA